MLGLRKMTWVLLGWVALIVVWVIAGASQADCENEVGDAAQLGCEAGTGIGVGLVVLFGFLGFFVLGFIWLATRPKRHCPACGRDAKKGRTTCQKCGYDFARGGAVLPPPSPA